MYIYNLKTEISAKVHEKRTLNRELNDLNKKIEKKKPKKKFALSRKQKTVTKSDESEKIIESEVVVAVQE